MSDKDKLQAQLQGIKAALDELELEYNKGLVDLGRYLQLKASHETSKAELERQLAGPARNPQTRRPAREGRKSKPATGGQDHTNATAQASGSPFIIGRPLRADEPLFGREAALRFVAGQLGKFSSVNLVGERRMGKTSLLNHLLGRPETHLPPQADHPPLALARLDLQGGVSHEERFYGAALRELLEHLPPSRSAVARDLREQQERLRAQPQASYDELSRALERLRDEGGVYVRPVLVVDEFERLLEPSAGEGFPYPGFFNGLRALITADLLAMIVASRLSLADYFRDPARPGSLTSTFPSYFTPFTLAPLDDEASDALLLQPSDHPLPLQDAAQARAWAGGHPCHLQAAGQALYEARAERRSSQWARERFVEIKGQACMTRNAAAPPEPPARPNRLRRALRALFWDAPLQLGRLAQRLGARLDDAAAWILGAVVIVLIVLLLLGVASGGDVLDAIRGF